MLKKGLLKVLTLALVLGALTLNSCKDHESRFESVEGRLAKIEKADYTKQVADLKTALTAATKLAAEDVKALDTKIKELKATNKIELDKATKKLEELIAKGATKVELEAAIKDLVAKSATKAELADAVKKLTDSNASTKTELEAAIKELASNSATKAELEAAKNELTASGNATKTELEAAIKVLVDKSATKVELENVKKELTAKLVSLEAFNLYKKEMDKSLAGVSKSIKEINGLLATVQGDLKNKATKEAVTALQKLLEGQIEGVKTQIETQKTTLTALVEDYKKVNDAAVKANKDAIAANKNATDTNKGAIEKNSKRLDKVEGDIKGINTKLGTIQNDLKSYATVTALSQTNSRINTIEALLNITNGKSTIFTDLDTKIDDLKDNLLKKIGKNGTDIKTLDGKIKTLNTELTTLKGKYNTQKGLIDGLTKLTGTHTADLKELWTAVNSKASSAEMKKSIDKLNNILGKTDGVTKLIDMVKDNQTLSDGLKKTIDANKKAADKIKTDLEGKITKLDGDIKTAYTAAIQALKNDNAAKDKTFETAIASSKKAISRLDENFRQVANALALNFESLSRRLTGLTFVPDYYVNSIPAIQVTTLRTGCFDITPNVTVAYKLSPSYISKEDLDWKNIGFATNKSTNMRKAPGAAAQTAAANYATATFNRIENGTLYVDVTFNREWVARQTDLTYQSRGVETFPTVALQVPFSKDVIAENKLDIDKAGTATVKVNNKTYPAGAIVTASQYIRVDVSDFTRADLSLVKKENKKVLAGTLAAAKSLTVKGIDGATVTNPTVFSLAYGKDKSLDLKDKVIALLKGLAIDSKYGYTYSFDLMDEKGQKIVYNRGSNKTNQQEFINLKDGVVTARVFDDSGISASQGRTPIVRVLAYPKGGEKCPLIGFIKIKLEDKPAPKPVVIAKKTLKTKTIVCGTDLDELVFGVKEMNVQVYNQVAISSKTDFHKAYSWQVDPTNDGTLYVAPDAQKTDTYVTKWRIPSSLILNKLLTKDQYTFRAKGWYKSSLPATYPDIEFSYEVTYQRPAFVAHEIKAPELISKYWFGNNSYIKHNVFVPESGETNENKAVFETNLSQVFEQTADKKIKSLKDKDYRYEFVAYGSGRTQQESQDKTYLFVSKDGQEVWSKGEVVARILPYDAAKGHILQLNKNSNEAKRLLNAGRENLRIRIKIVTDKLLCGNDIDDMTVKVAGRNDFLVHFVRPLETEAQSTEYFIDGYNFGEEHTYLDIAKLLNLYDWRYTENKYNSSFVQYPWYNQYYGIESLTVDSAAIKTNLNGVWKNVTDYPNLEVKSVPSPFIVKGKTIATSVHGFVTYKNNSNVLGQKFDLQIPVKIEYTWGTIQSFTVTVPVEKTVRQ